MTLSNTVPADAVLDALPQPLANHAMVTTESAELAQGPLAQARQAMAMGLSIPDMRELLALQKEFEAGEARKAFDADMAAYKLNPPEILKDKTVFFESSKGVTTYDQATLGGVCQQIIATAAKHGFTHRWVPSLDGAQRTITCVVKHRLGHYEETSLSGPRDPSPHMNALQANQSTDTYLQRYSLLMAFGFAPKDAPDDDGRGFGPAPEDAATAKTPDAVEGDPSENEMTKMWANRVHACKSLDTLRGIRKEANRAFVEAQDQGRWVFFRNWIDGRIADMNGTRG